MLNTDQLRTIIDEAICVFIFEHEYMDEKIIVKAVRELDVYVTFTKEDQKRFHMDVIARVHTAFNLMKFVFWNRSMKFEDSCKYGDVSNQLLLQFRSEGYLTKHEISKSYQRRWAIHDDLIWTNRNCTIAYKARLMLNQEHADVERVVRRPRYAAGRNNQNGPYGNDQHDRRDRVEDDLDDRDDNNDA